MDEIDPKMFEDIRYNIDMIHQHSSQIETDREKVGKRSKRIQSAEAAILSTEERALNALQMKNNYLRNKLDREIERRSAAIKYWQDYGFDVEQISDSEYAFIYTKLKGDEELLQPITVVMKLHDGNRIQIVSRTPTDALTDEVVETLNGSLETSCYHPGDERVDFKLAMLKIKKALNKRPDP